MVIYEWNDAPYLGKETDPDAFIPVSQLRYLPHRDLHLQEKTYVCTSDAFSAGFCSKDDLGKFILNLPDDHAANQTSFWTARVSLPNAQPSSNRDGLWNPPGQDLPELSDDKGPVNWRRHDESAQSGLNPSPDGVYTYKADEPIQYQVRKTGYYCVGPFIYSFCQVVC